MSIFIHSMLTVAAVGLVGLAAGLIMSWRVRA